MKADDRRFSIASATVLPVRANSLSVSPSVQVMQLVGSLYVLYFPYCGFILWEACSAGNQHRLHAHPRIATVASLLLAFSPLINGLLYGLKSQTLRRSVQNYWRKKATKSELQQVISNSQEDLERSEKRRVRATPSTSDVGCSPETCAHFFIAFTRSDVTSDRVSGDTSENAKRRGFETAFRQRERFLLPFPTLAAEAQRGIAGPRLVQNRQ